MALRLRRRPCRSASALAAGFALLAVAIAGAGPARAGEFYVSGGLSISWGVSESSGLQIQSGVPLAGGTFAGGDSDSSAGIAGAVGFEFPMHQLLPRRSRMPRWMPDLDLEDWGIRTEIEGSGLRNYELTAVNGVGTLFTSVDHWAVLLNGYLDLPLGHALEALFGRMRRLEPFVFSPTFGLGYAGADLVANSNLISGMADDGGFAWQAGAEVGYPLSDSVVLSGGYRYLAIGEFSSALIDGSGQPAGTLGLDVSGHELRTSVRFRFYSIRFPRNVIESGRRRYEP